MVFHEYGLDCATTERFDPHSASSRVKIKKTRIRDGRSQNIEESFAQPIARWAKSLSFQTLQNAAAKCSGDDAHGSGDSRQMVAALPMRRKRLQNLLQLRVARGGLRERERFFARHFQNFAVAQWIRNVKSQIAGLPRAEKLSRSSEEQVGFRDFKSIRRAHHRFKPRAGVFVHARRRDQNAVGFVSSAADSSAQLMQLGQTESLGV